MPTHSSELSHKRLGSGDNQRRSGCQRRQPKQIDQSGGEETKRHQYGSGAPFVPFGTRDGSSRQEMPLSPTYPEPVSSTLQVTESLEEIEQVHQASTGNLIVTQFKDQELREAMSGSPSFKKRVAFTSQHLKEKASKGIFEYTEKDSLAGEVALNSSVIEKKPSKLRSAKSSKLQVKRQKSRRSRKKVTKKKRIISQKCQSESMGTIDRMSQHQLFTPPYSQPISEGHQPAMTQSIHSVDMLMSRNQNEPEFKNLVSGLSFGSSKKIFNSTSNVIKHMKEDQTFNNDMLVTDTVSKPIRQQAPRPPVGST